MNPSIVNCVMQLSVSSTRTYGVRSAACPSLSALPSLCLPVSLPQCPPLLRAAPDGAKFKPPAPLNPRTQHGCMGPSHGSSCAYQRYSLARLALAALTSSWLLRHVSAGPCDAWSCGGHGTCTATGGSPACQCGPGFNGTHCDNVLSVSPRYSRLLLTYDSDFVDGTRLERMAFSWPPAGSVSNSIVQEGGPGLGANLKPAPVSPFLGWRFGTRTGPIYKFLIQARDGHDQPRDYQSLPKKTSTDYVVVKIGAQDYLLHSSFLVAPPQILVFHNGCPEP